MAKQKGPIYLKGTAGNKTYYRMGGRYYVRKKTSLDKERFYRDAAFARSRKAAGVFGIASKIASELYQMLPQQKKGHGVIGRLSGKANKLLHEGNSKEAVWAALYIEYLEIAQKFVEKAPLELPKHRLYTPESLLQELAYSNYIQIDHLQLSLESSLLVLAPLAPT